MWIYQINKSYSAKNGSKVPSNSRSIASSILFLLAAVTKFENKSDSVYIRNKNEHGKDTRGKIFTVFIIIIVVG